MHDAPDIELILWVLSTLERWPYYGEKLTFYHRWRLFMQFGNVL